MTRRFRAIGVRAFEPEAVNFVVHPGAAMRTYNRALNHRGRIVQNME